jgi:ubiquitin-protein ligase
MGLPRVLVQKRVANEIGMCRRNLTHKIKVKDETLSTFPITIKVILRNVPGPVMRNDKLEYKYTHKIRLEITEEYPYQKPLVVWLTDIFHPNVMPPEEGGFVCTKLLDNWSFSSDLLSFIKGIETLLLTPNPENPYDTDTCTRAAKYFNEHGFKPPLVINED